MSIHNLKYEVTRYARRGPGKVLDSYCNAYCIHYHILYRMILMYL